MPYRGTDGNTTICHLEAAMRTRAQTRRGGAGPQRRRTRVEASDKPGDWAGNEPATMGRCRGTIGMKGASTRVEADGETQNAWPTNFMADGCHSRWGQRKREGGGGTSAHRGEKVPMTSSAAKTRNACRRQSRRTRARGGVNTVERTHACGDIW